jgi:hypothetical protein
MGSLRFRGSIPNFTVGHSSFWGSSQLKFYSVGFGPFGVFTGIFSGSGAQNQICFRGLLPIVRSPNSNLTWGICPSLDPLTQIWLLGFCPFAGTKSVLSWMAIILKANKVIFILSIVFSGTIRRKFDSPEPQNAPVFPIISKSPGIKIWVWQPPKNTNAQQ